MSILRSCCPICSSPVSLLADLFAGMAELISGNSHKCLFLVVYDFSCDDIQKVVLECRLRSSRCHELLALVHYIFGRLQLFTSLIWFSRCSVFIDVVIQPLCGAWSLKLLCALLSSVKQDKLQKWRREKRKKKKKKEKITPQRLKNWKVRNSRIVK